MWKSRIDTYRDVDFAPYVTEGLILAHFLMDEPGPLNTWGGRADIEEMARYSKSIWPTTVLAAAPYSVAAVAAARGGTSCLGHDST